VAHKLINKPVAILGAVRLSPSLHVSFVVIL